MVILVTGAAGFIGSNLIDKLLELDYNVIGVDNFLPNYHRSIKDRNIKSALSKPNFTFYAKDIGDDNFAESINNFDIETIIHLAAQPGIRASFSNPTVMAKNDISATINILETIRKMDIENYIFGSSSSVYGNNSTPFNELSTPTSPISPYAAMKCSCESFNKMYHNQYGFNIHNLRFFTVYGPRQRPDMGIHKFVRQIISGDTIEMYGEGASFRDYTFVSDIVDGILLSLKNINGYRTINLGSGETTKLEELINPIWPK